MDVKIWTSPEEVECYLSSSFRYHSDDLSGVAWGFCWDEILREVNYTPLVLSTDLSLLSTIYAPSLKFIGSWRLS